MTSKTIGYCGVDSGQLLIADPCYLKDWRAGDYDPVHKRGDGNHYNEACYTTMNEDMGGEVLISGVAGTGVAVSTGYGDGNYPVVAHYKDGRVQKITITFF